MPLLVTLVASDLKFGSTGPCFCMDLATFWTVSTVTDEVSCAPTSAKFAPVEKICGGKKSSTKEDVLMKKEDKDYLI